VFCSCIGIVGASFAVTFPLIICVLYFRKVKSTEILPKVCNVKPEDFTEIYGSDDIKIIEEISAKAFTEEKCVEFATRYGVLLKGLDVSRMGRQASILVPCVSLIRRLLMALAVTFLYKKPILCIFAVNYITLFYITFFAWQMPYQSS
jgi:hypothetical protein